MSKKKQKENEITSLALPSKELGSTIIKAADHQLNQQDTRKVVNQVVSRLEIKRLLLKTMDEIQAKIKRINRELELLDMGKFTFTDSGFIKFTDEDLGEFKDVSLHG